jgi:hypothetical protein
MRIKFLAGLVFVFLASLAIFTIANAQTGSGFDLSWNVVSSAGGSGEMSGSGFSLAGTVGQTAAGPTSGSGFEVGQGFWFGLKAMPKVYLPLILKP